MSRAGDRSGKSWGSGESPDCSGFTTAEFEQLDFSRIDMSEFIQEIASSVRIPSASPSDRTSKALSSSASTATTTDETIWAYLRWHSVSLLCSSEDILAPI
jgi:hypothetical protein